MKITFYLCFILLTLFINQSSRNKLSLKGQELDKITIINTLPECTALSGYLTDSAFTWVSIENATGYLVSVGTSPDATDIANMVDVDFNAFNSPIPFPLGEQVYVTIIPYNSEGLATGCSEESFFINDDAGCSNVTFPVYNAMNVPVDTNISWDESTSTVGYTIGLGTSTGDSDIMVAVDVGNVNTFDPPFDLPENTEIYVTITSYNHLGLGTVCGDDMFTTGISTTLGCTNLSAPVNDDTNVSITASLSWNAITEATGYLLSIGTTSGGTDILNSEDVGNVLSYTTLDNFPDNTVLYVNITPYNVVGLANGCVEESFTTEAQLNLPICTTLSAPINSETNVLTTAILSWDASVNATGYFLSIGTTSGGTDILNSEDVGNVLSYTAINNFPNNTDIYVTITPYNPSGLASGCIEESFTTETLPNLPSCSSLISPSNGAVDVSITTNITWSLANNATGYLISIGTTSGGTNILNNEDVGSQTTIDLALDLPEQTDIYVLIIPYNDNGEALSCAEQQFTTVSRLVSNSTMIIPKYFTPNNDTVHDQWVIQGSELKIEVVYIYNRFGKLLKTINSAPFSWNGNYNNQLLPQNDYWYEIQLFSRETITGHFTLRR